MPDDSVISALKQSYDLLGVVEPLVDLHKQGHFYIGPCPLCGGTDRFNLTYTPLGWRWHCRKCSTGAYFDSIHLMEKLWGLGFAATVERMAASNSALTEAERLEIALERARRAKEELDAQIAAAERALAALRNAHAWDRYHDNLTDITRQLWQYRGVPDFWQDWWQLGYDPQHAYWIKDIQYESPSLSIPIFAQGWSIRNIRHRLLTPHDPTDRYRPETKGLPPAPWLSDPDHAINGPTIAVEGEIKAMVVAATYDDERLPVVGLPGKTPGAAVLSVLDRADPVYLCPDPDMGEKERQALIDQLRPERVRVITLPGKIDDLILQYHLNKSWITWLLHTATKG